MGFMSTYTPTVETPNWNNVEFVLAVDRLVKGALQGVNARYQALLEADSTYQAFLAEADRARANARTYRQTAKTFGQKAEEMDGKERTAALMEAQFYDGLAEAEEEKTVASPELKAGLGKLWENAYSSVTGQLGYDTWKKLGREAASIEGEITAAIYQGLHNEERRIAIEASQPYLKGVRSSAEGLLKQLFGEHVYVGENQVTHVDGRLDHRIPTTIYTDEVTARKLQRELTTPECVLTLGHSETIPLNDANDTIMITAEYRGSKPLH